MELGGLAAEFAEIDPLVLLAVIYYRHRQQKHRTRKRRTSADTPSEWTLDC